LENVTVTPSSGGWGNFYNYTVNVSDATGEVVNVSFYVKKTVTGSWQFIESRNCTSPCTGTTMAFNKTGNYTCADGGGAFWYFKFNATDDLGTTNTTAEGPVIVEEPVINTTNTTESETT